MKLKWLMVVALGVVVSACGEVNPSTGTGPEQADNEQLENVLTVEPAQAVTGGGEVSAMAVTCGQYGYNDGACGCSAGSSCGFTQTKYYREGTCATACNSCSWGAWKYVSTICAASSSCTFC